MNFGLLISPLSHALICSYTETITVPGVSPRMLGNIVSSVVIIAIYWSTLFQALDRPFFVQYY